MTMKDFLRNYYTIIIILLLALVVIEALIIINQAGTAPANQPAASQETITTTTIPPLDSSIHFGGDYQDEYPAHEVVFEGLVGHDPTRKDYIYASAGEVRFKLASKPNRSSQLVVTIANLNELCRKNEIYADGQLLGTIFKKTNETNFPTIHEFNITPKYDNVNVRIVGKGNENHMPDECDWGNDLQSAELREAY
jgi:hypothetical protein